MKTAFVYTDRYFESDYGCSHPLKIERLKLTFDLCKAYKLFDLTHPSLIEGAPATEAEVLRGSFMVKHAPSWVALGGGGYNIINVARAWTLAWAIMNKVNLPHQLPEAMASDLAPARSLRDPARVSGRRDVCRQRMKEVVEYLGRNLFPIHERSK